MITMTWTKIPEEILDKFYDSKFYDAYFNVTRPVRRVYWEIYDYLFENDKYLKRFKKSHDLMDLYDYLRKSKRFDWDIENVAHWNRYYEYIVDEVYHHTHSLQELCRDLIFIYYKTPDPKIEFTEEYYHEDELRLLKQFIEVLKGERQVI